jgi:hypothetical protein
LPLHVDGCFYLEQIIKLKIEDGSLYTWMPFQCLLPISFLDFIGGCSYGQVEKIIIIHQKKSWKMDKEEQLDELRSLWEFSAVSQYLHLFYETFGLSHFETEELENSLLSPSTSSFLTELHVKMMRVLTLNRFNT